MTNFERVKEFHNAFHVQMDVWPPSEAIVGLRLDLIHEEWNELQDEFSFLEFDKKKIAKELSDLLYVIYGTAATFGINIDQVFEEVHKSNMSKLGNDGKPVYRKDGKVLKGPNYKEANLDFVL